MNRRFFPNIIAVAFWAVLPLAADAGLIVIDFNDPLQANTLDVAGNTIGTFDVTAFGFTEAQRATLYDSILTEVRRDFHSIPTQATDPSSPIPAGKELNIDFSVGDIGTVPSDPTYYYMQVGTGVSGPHIGFLGVADYAAALFPSGIGDTVGSVFTDQINGLGGVGNVLTTGNLMAATHAITGTLSHEIAHTLSLLHLDKAGAVTPNGLPPLMGTGAIDLPNIDRIFDREFAYSGTNSQNFGGSQFHVQQLVNALGLRDSVAVPEPSSFAFIGLAGAAFYVRRFRRRGVDKAYPSNLAD